MVFHQAGLDSTQYTVAVLCQFAQIAVALLIPVRELPGSGQIFDLIDEAAAQTAAVYLLQGHQVILTQHLCDFVQGAVALAVRQQVLPAAGNVMVIGLSVDADLNVETEQPETGTGPLERLCLITLVVNESGRGWSKYRHDRAQPFAVGVVPRLGERQRQVKSFRSVQSQFGLG